MRISDWSSDVCSSDLPARQEVARARTERPDKRCDIGEGGAAENILCCARAILAALDAESDNIYSERAQRDNFAPNKSVRGQNGGASCRERECQYVSISGVAAYLKTKKKKT